MDKNNNLWNWFWSEAGSNWFWGAIGLVLVYLFPSLKRGFNGVISKINEASILELKNQISELKKMLEGELIKINAITDKLKSVENDLLNLGDIKKARIEKVEGLTYRVEGLSSKFENLEKRIDEMNLINQKNTTNIENIHATVSNVNGKLDILIQSWKP